jgi:hypothetical protein
MFVFARDDRAFLGTPVSVPSAAHNVNTAANGKQQLASHRYIFFNHVLYRLLSSNLFV